MNGRGSIGHNTEKDKSDHMTFKNSCASKDTTETVNMAPVEWEETRVPHGPHAELPGQRHRERPRLSNSGTWGHVRVHYGAVTRLTATLAP